VALIPSPILGPKGNVEFLADFRLDRTIKGGDHRKLIKNALERKPEQ
jgi:hypothetical protein